MLQLALTAGGPPGQACPNRAYCTTMNDTTQHRTADLLARWRNGDQQAAAVLFHRYADRLVALAKSRLSARLASRVDPEDVVQSVYRSFFVDARVGRYDV